MPLSDDIKRCDENMQSVHPYHDFRSGVAEVNPEAVKDIAAFKRVLAAANRFAELERRVDILIQMSEGNIRLLESMPSIHQGDNINILQNELSRRNFYVSLLRDFTEPAYD